MGVRATPHAQLQFCNGTLYRQGFVQQSTDSGRTHYLHFRFVQLNRTFLPLCVLLFLFTFSIEVFRSVSGLSLIVRDYSYLSYLIGLDVAYHDTVDDSNPIRNSKTIASVRRQVLYSTSTYFGASSPGYSTDEGYILMRRRWAEEREEAK